MSAPTTEYQKYQADLERRAKATGTSAQELERAETLVEQARRKNGKGQPIPKPLSDEERAELRKVQLRERRPELWTATQIVTTDFPDPKWIVPGLIHEGFAILAGVPKLGKSWMGLNLAIAVSVGGRFLGEIEVEQGGVLLLSLEDSGARMSRIGASLLLHGTVLTVGDLLERIDEVTLDAVREVAKRVLSADRVLAVVGPFTEADFPG